MMLFYIDTRGLFIVGKGEKKILIKSCDGALSVVKEVEK